MSEPTYSPLGSEYQQAIDAATRRIAPNWPLDRLIAVNPLWQYVDMPFEQATAEVAALGGASSYLPLTEYQRWYQEGKITPDKVLQAAQEYHLHLPLASLESRLFSPRAMPAPWRNLAAWADVDRPRDRMPWHDEVTHQISQFCAAHYQHQRPMLGRAYRSQAPNLYQHWLQVARSDKGLSIILDEPGLSDLFSLLPQQQEALFSLVIEALELTPEQLSYYGQSLLLDINGWASYLSYLRFEATKQGQQQDDLVALLAIKLAWEWVIWQHYARHHGAEFGTLKQGFFQQKQGIAYLLSRHDDDLLHARIWARALELSEQARLQQQLTGAEPARQHQSELQAIFCIDVRSEVYRRALESQSPHIETYGFAGFFGLPIEYEQAGTQLRRPQLPGLLAPAIKVVATQYDNSTLRRDNQQASLKRWGNTATATFSMVESMGWWYAFKLFKQSLGLTANQPPALDGPWQLSQEGKVLSSADQAQLAKGILETMGITNFAPTVLLVGHGSHSCNNLQNAALECGACGGQTGEVNVKVLAQLLNDSEVRQHLAQLGCYIPTGTRFVPALHHTITDEIRCFQALQHETIALWLKQATDLAQRERCQRGIPELAGLPAAERRHALQQRAQDWSQIRPEWGLANNQAFVIAPRRMSRNMNFDGRAFLHDYQWEQDTDFAILERLMTAPMLVTHWINAQYYFSTTDNHKFGSGNKVLHNAVGGHIGLFEGNGGDLRIGLAQQSLHDGRQWMHTPVRLSVYIRAPEHAIADIVARHPILQQLVHHRWLYVFCWQGASLSQLTEAGWETQQSSESTASVAQAS